MGGGMDARTRLRLARRALQAWRGEEERAVLALGAAVQRGVRRGERGPLLREAAAAMRASAELAELVWALEVRAIVGSPPERGG
jgi:hypothetical protein